MKHNHHQTVNTIIRNARVVTADHVLPESSVVLQDGYIHEIDSNRSRPGYRDIDAKGKLLLPGFIDIHSDVIENAIQPRPGGRFPVDIALQELDKQLVACGVTTIFHCLCFLDSDENPPFRNSEMTDFMIHEIHALRDSFKAGTYIHARYEITNCDAFELVKTLIKQKLIHFFSIMDHTPGQGQFSKISQFRSYYSEVRRLTLEHVDAIIERRLSARDSIDWKKIAHLAELCRDKMIRMASHDDDSAEKVELVGSLGVTISEFPVNIEAARAAHKLGMMISLGSPNVLRGSSLTGNLSGREALNAGLGDILCSDYAPMSLLHACLQLSRDGTMNLPQAVRLISLNPARAAGLDHLTGSIEPGKLANLVIVDDSRKVAAISKTLVRGREVFCSGE